MEKFSHIFNKPISKLFTLLSPMPLSTQLEEAPFSPKPYLSDLVRWTTCHLLIYQCPQI